MHAFRYEGHVDDFLCQSQRSHQGKVNILHSSFDPVHILVNGNRAISDGFCLITSLIAIDGIDYELASYVRLASRLEKTFAGWRICTLEAMYVRDRLITAFAGAAAQHQLSLPVEIMAYPKSYRHLAFVMLRRGLKPRNGLPHEGDSRSVRSVLEKNSDWLGEAL